MSLLDDIATKLDDAGVGDIAATGGSSTGWTIYKSYQSASPDKAITINELPGDQRDQTEGTEYEFPGFQVTVRGPELEYDTARTKMDEVITALNNATISGFVYIFADASPIPLGFDEDQRPVIAINFSTMKAV